MPRPKFREAARFVVKDLVKERRPVNKPRKTAGVFVNKLSPSFIKLLKKKREIKSGNARWVYVDGSHYGRSSHVYAEYLGPRTKLRKNPKEPLAGQNARTARMSSDIRWFDAKTGKLISKKTLLVENLYYKED